jgi:vitamin B12 transporter
MKFKSKFTAFFMAVQLLGFSQTDAKNQSKNAVQSPLKESNPLAQNQSQQDTTYLNEVILNDLKAPLGPNFRGATQVILGSSDLLPFRTRGVAAALNQLAGIEVNGSRGPQGSILSIYARGGRSKQALVVIDGIRVADPASASLSYDLRLLDISQIESIKVIKGANSSLYGTNAGVVVIDISTKKAVEKPIGFVLNTHIGTHQTAENQNNSLNYTSVFTGLSGGIASWNYALRYSQLNASGVSSFNTPGQKEDPFSQSGLHLSLGKNFFEKLSAKLIVETQKISADYDDAFMGIDAENTFQTTRNHLASLWTWRQIKGVLKASVSLASYDSKDISAYGSSVFARNINAELLYRYFVNEQWNIITGVQYINDQIEDNPDQNTPANEYTIMDPFASIGFKQGRFDMQFGGRFNHHSQYGGQWVYHVNPSLFLDQSEQFRAHLSFSSAYITPTLGMFFGAYGANVDLLPETNQNTEFGLSFNAKNGPQMGLTYFDRKEQQAIYFNGPAFLYENQMNDTWAKGLEFQLASSLGAQFNVQANYSWTQVSETAIRIPKHKANFNLQFSPSEFAQWSFSLAYTGKRLDTDFTTYEQKTLKAFSLIDLQYGFPLGLMNSKGFVSVNNLANVSFEETVGFQTLGRNIRLGIEIGL